jgi:molybdopterin converting factor small subunit
MVEIRLASFLAERVGGINSVEVSADTIGLALRALTEQYPDLTRLIWAGGDGAVNPITAVFLNNELLGPRQLETSVKPGDQIEILAMVSGGV